MARRVRASAVCVHERELLCVRLRDPLSRVARLFVPGGQLEPPETPAQAAIREAFEETGYHIALDPSSELVVPYPFVWAGQRIECQTHFFRATLQSPRDSPAPIADADYHEGVVWLPLHDLVELDFSAAIYAAVRSLLPAAGPRNVRTSDS
jgi:8-oxo-dGTP pyrophosphatase MutT (NUDIX family)